jgi:hypothetical protein
MQPKSSLLAQLEQHQTTYAEEAAFRQQVIDFLHRNDAFWQRTTLEGHITGSAWVLSPDRGSALLIHHKKLNRWMQPGGHVDETDETVAHTALRELREETGMKDARLLRPYLFDVDVHEIPAVATNPRTCTSTCATSSKLARWNLPPIFQKLTTSNGCHWQALLPKAQNSLSGGWL